MKNILVLSLLFYTIIFGQDSTLVPVSLDTIYVTTGRYVMNINDLPYSASAVTIEKINRSTFQSVPELLQRQSGLSLIRDGIWGTEISIRGLNRSNIVVLIDGSRVETSTDISARLSMIDINDIERIEVIKGAASSLYGTGASGGVVNIISRRPNYNYEFYLKGNISSGYNSVNNNFNEGVNLFAGSAWWAAKISASFRKAGNIKTPSGVLNNSQFKDNSLSGLFTVRPFEYHELQVNIQQFNAYNVGIPGAYPVFPMSAAVRYPLERRRLYNVDYRISSVNRYITKITAKYYYQDIERDVENIPNQVQVVTAANGQKQRITVQKILPGAMHFTNGLLFQTDFVFNNHYLIAGIDYWKRRYSGERSRWQKIEILAANDSVTRTNFRTIYEKPLPDAGYRSTGIFLQDEIRLIENVFSLTVGGRYDDIGIENDSVRNPLYEVVNGNTNYNPASTLIWNAGKVKNSSYSYSAGVVYKFSEQGSITFNAAHSFRSPSLEERYQFIDQGNIIRVGDPALKPEKGYFFDFGTSYSGTDFKSKVGLFYNRLTDLVTEIPGVFEGRKALVKTNIGKADLYGFEAEGNYNLYESALFYTTISYVRGKNLADKNNLPQIPPFNGTSGFRIKIYRGFETEIAAVYFAGQNDIAPGELKTPGYAYYNLSAGYTADRIGGMSINLFAGVENIFNREYRNHLSTTRGLFVTEPGRNFYLKLSLSL